jgi:cell division protein FtsL
MPNNQEELFHPKLPNLSKNSPQNKPEKIQTQNMINPKNFSNYNVIDIIYTNKILIITIIVTILIIKEVLIIKMMKLYQSQIKQN